MRRSSYAASQKAQYTRRSTGEITYSRPEAVAGDGRRLHRAACRTRGHERGRSHHRHSEEQRRIASAEGEFGHFCEGQERLAVQDRLQGRPGPGREPGPAGPAGPAGPGRRGRARRRGRGRPARLHRRDPDADERELGRHARRRRYVALDTSTPLAVTVPANETDKLIVTFSGEDACYGGTSVRFCNVRITVDGNELAPASGSDANWDNNDLGVSGAVFKAKTSSDQESRAIVRVSPHAVRRRALGRRAVPGLEREYDVPPGRLGSRRPARPRHLTESRS